MRYEVLFKGLVVVTDSDDPDVEVEAHLDGVMEELVRLKATDPGVGLTGATGVVEISVVVKADGLDNAMSVGASLIRSAVHAAGGHTPGWTITWIEARLTDTTQLIPA